MERLHQDQLGLLTHQLVFEILHQGHRQHIQQHQMLLCLLANIERKPFVLSLGLYMNIQRIHLLFLQGKLKSFLFTFILMFYVCVMKI